jgi:hypothetical protein
MAGGRERGPRGPVRAGGGDVGDDVEGVVRGDRRLPDGDRGVLERLVRGLARLLELLVAGLAEAVGGLAHALGQLHTGRAGGRDLRRHGRS